MTGSETDKTIIVAGLTGFVIVILAFELYCARPPTWDYPALIRVYLSKTRLNIAQKTFQKHT